MTHCLFFRPSLYLVCLLGCLFARLFAYFSAPPILPIPLDDRQHCPAYLSFVLRVLFHFAIIIWTGACCYGKLGIYCPTVYWSPCATVVHLAKCDRFTTITLAIFHLIISQRPFFKSTWLRLLFVRVTHLSLPHLHTFAGLAWITSQMCRWILNN